MIKILHTLILLFLFAGAASAQDLNKEALDAIVAGNQRTNADALLILKDGKVAYRNEFGKSVKPIEAMSASKSVVSLAVGLMIDHGFLKYLDQPVSSFYPEWKQGRKKNITVRHLLTHTSGLQNVTNAGIEVEVAPDGVQLALAAELESEPGSVYSYNNKATNLLAGVVEKASGMKLDAFLKKYLFDQIGIGQFNWRKDKAGNPIGMAGLQIMPEDLAKIGQLIINGGKWDAKQVVSAKWLEQSFAPLAQRPESGLMWWLIYDKQFMVIDDEFLAKVRSNTDDATFSLLGKMKGRYEGFEKLQAHMRSAYSATEMPTVAKALSTVSPAEMRIENEGDVVGYAAVGYLGQYLIVIPKKNIVVVRMISADSYKQVPNNSDLSPMRRWAKEL
jgi:CubicO group peptidase (beta-lactamase class C family)